MLTADQIEQAIAPSLPAEHRAQAPALAHLLADLAAGTLSFGAARAEVAGSAALAQALGALGGQEVTADGAAVLRFGAGSQLGDVSVRDVVGGNIVTISLPAQIPQRQQIDEQRTYGCLGLPIFSITSSRTIITLALTIFFGGAILGGLFGNVSGGRLPTTEISTAIAWIDETQIAATVGAAIRQTTAAETTAQSVAAATALASGGTAATATIAALSTALTATAQAVSTTQTTIAMAVATPADVSAANPVAVAPGTQLQSAGWSYTFSRPDYATPLAGPIGDYQPRNGRFILVLISIANGTGQAQPLPARFFVLKDAQGRVWEARPEVSAAYVIPGVNADLSQGQAIPPDGLSRNVALIFDLVPDATHLLLFARSDPTQGWLVIARVD